jgi:1,4-dihydroxy-2-naphthoate octaprenyltransferase
LPVKVWIQAARLRTLPLAIAGTVSGNLLAYAESGSINPLIFILSILTAVFLQVLSNYANDYGDFRNGADTAERTDRVMASGLLTEQKMKQAIGVLIGLCLVCGISLLAVAIQSLNSSFWILLGTGLAGIMAAYYYTAGKNPYGYIGLGDISVFIFFGLLSVCGTYYLQAQTLDSPIWWIAVATGLLSVGVLNVNNIRDIETDQLKNKITIPVRIGKKYATRYHLILLYAAFFCFVLYNINRQGEHAFSSPFFWIFLFIFQVLEGIHISKLKKATDRPAYNQQLKFLSLSTFILSLIFALINI